VPVEEPVDAFVGVAGSPRLFFCVGRAEPRGRWSGRLDRCVGAEWGEKCGKVSGAAWGERQGNLTRRPRPEPSARPHQKRPASRRGPGQGLKPGLVPTLLRDGSSRVRLALRLLRAREELLLRVLGKSLPRLLPPGGSERRLLIASSRGKLLDRPCVVMYCRARSRLGCRGDRLPPVIRARAPLAAACVSRAGE